VALSSAAVLTIYSAGFLRTRAAADRIQAADRSRVVVPESSDDRVHPERPPQVASSAVVVPPPVADATIERHSKQTSPDHHNTAEHPSTVATEPADLPTAAGSASPTAGVTPLTASAATTAQASTPAPTPEPTPTPAPAAQYKDGTYSGWGTSRHGDIEATVVIAAGRITSAQITQCWTRYSCSWVAHLQGQVVDRQSPEVDYVSGATQSTNAYYYAVVQALSKAK
jgi:uncharacterized protein with FMN-binding domain